MRRPRRDARTALVVTLVAGAAFLTGLLANGGGILLVPIFVLVLGFTATRAAGTSMVAVAALIVPTLATHWLPRQHRLGGRRCVRARDDPGDVRGCPARPSIPETASCAGRSACVLVAFAVWFLATRVAL